MGLFFNHKCKVCKVKRPNNLMRPSGAKWICVDCQREANLGKGGKR